MLVLLDGEYSLREVALVARDLNHIFAGENVSDYEPSVGDSSSFLYYACPIQDQVRRGWAGDCAGRVGWEKAGGVKRNLCPREICGRSRSGRRGRH